MTRVSIRYYKRGNIIGIELSNILQKIGTFLCISVSINPVLVETYRR